VQALLGNADSQPGAVLLVGELHELVVDSLPALRRSLSNLSMKARRPRTRRQETIRPLGDSLRDLFAVIFDGAIILYFVFVFVVSARGLFLLFFG
jgi:hypothetical protein